MLRFTDPPRMPGTGESLEERLARAADLAGTPGQLYVERRAVPVRVAGAAGVRFDADFGGRPAVLAPLTDQAGTPVSLHGRYLHNVRGQNKMLTIGPDGGALSVLDGWRADPLILVEGLFDALSLAVCGRACVATVGRRAPWLPEVASGRKVWLAFDNGRPGEADAARYAKLLRRSDVCRLLPPPRCKDWNTALIKRGRGAVTRWLHESLGASGTTAS